VNRYLLSSNLVDAVLVGMFSMIPAVLIIAWFHGAPGKDEWTPAEKIGVPLNLLVTAGLLVSLFHGKELGAAAEEVMLIDEQGQTVEHLIAKPAFRRKVAVFFFDNEGVQPEDDWLQYGMTQLLVTDLKQDSFIGVWSPWGGFEGSNIAYIRRAGYDDGTDVPVTLLQKVANKFYQQFFVTGEFTRDGEDYVFTAQLYSVEPARLVSEHEVRGRDPMRLADLLSTEIQEEVVLVEGTEEVNPDLPVAELLTDSVVALHHFVDGRMALLLDSDQEAAVEHLKAAVEADPSFALAHGLLAQVYQVTGNTSEALEATKMALQHDYKLARDTRFLVKSLDYSLQGQMDKVTRVIEMWTEIQPDNPEAHTQMAFIYMFFGDQREKALESFGRARELGEDWVLMYEAKLHEANGDNELAIDAYRQHADSFPEDSSPWVQLGQLYRRQGDLEKAREATERAALLGPEFVTPLVDLAELDLREGQVDEAWLNLEKAIDVARDDQQMAVVTRKIVDWHDAQGQMQAAADATDEYLNLQERFRDPVNLLAMQSGELDHYVKAGRMDDAFVRLEAFEGKIQPPFDRFIDLGYLMIYLEAEQPDLAEERLQVVDEFIRQMQRDDFAYAIQLSRGAILAQRGDMDGARAQMEKALDMFRRSVQGTLGDEDSTKYVILEALGRITLGQGDLEAADEYLTELLDGWPSHAPGNLNLARLRVAQGRDDEAREALERALHMWAKADPGYGPAEEARALQASL
jgi:tetratricopeptide (TPR) repeat protein